ncbi:unnamed protein product [Didymodactylos carnosus]|uniref:Uncharacterized protein n=1 Tax=Didymodactylos carnosus TaxID=1234261 RepID=A0A815T2X9_9BILA|nr:unnamed protein product [Didymodactylos carnosus]CAF4359784.1 unnamed protein product [Didymodactylos carnosus]
MAKQVVYMLSLVAFVWAYVFSTIDANPYQRAHNQGGDHYLKHTISRNVDDEDSHTKEGKLNALYEDSYGKKYERNEENRAHELQKHKEADSELEEKRNKYNRRPYEHSDKGSDSDSSDSNGYGSESRDDKYNRHPHRYAGKGSDSGDSNDYESDDRDERGKHGAPEQHDYSGSRKSDGSKPELHKKKQHSVENENKTGKNSELNLQFFRRHGGYSPHKPADKRYPEEKESYKQKPHSHIAFKCIHCTLVGII